LGAPGRHLAVYGIEPPIVTNKMRSSKGEGEVLLLDLVAHSREIKSSLKNKNQDLDLRERERGELKL
jgi:hypothetical protein